MLLRVASTFSSDIPAQYPASVRYALPCKAEHRPAQRILAFTIPPYRNDPEPLPEDFWE